MGASLEDPVVGAALVELVNHGFALIAAKVLPLLDRPVGNAFGARRALPQPRLTQQASVCGGSAARLHETVSFFKKNGRGKPFQQKKAKLRRTGLRSEGDLYFLGEGEDSPSHGNTIPKSLRCELSGRKTPTAHETGQGGGERHVCVCVSYAAVR